MFFKLSLIAFFLASLEVHYTMLIWIKVGSQGEYNLRGKTLPGHVAFQFVMDELELEWRNGFLGLFTFDCFTADRRSVLAPALVGWYAMTICHTDVFTNDDCKYGFAPLVSVECWHTFAENIRLRGVWWLFHLHNGISIGILMSGRKLLHNHYEGSRWFQSYPSIMYFFGLRMQHLTTQHPTLKAHHK